MPCRQRGGSAPPSSPIPPATPPEAAMRIRSINSTPVNLPFMAPYRFAYGSTASLTKTIVEVTTDEGLVGLGEAADGDTAAQIEQLGQRLVGADPLDLNECERRCVPAVSYLPWG